MTALDQAFIKAFTQQNTPTTVVAPRSAVPIPKSPLIRPKQGCDEGNGSPTEDYPKGHRQSVAEHNGHEAAISTPAALDGMLAALEKPPRAAASLLQTSGHFESIRRKIVEHEEDTDGQSAVGSQQWTVGSEPWVVDAQPWAFSSEQWAVDLGPCCCPVPEPPASNGVDAAEETDAAMPLPQQDEIADLDACAPADQGGVSALPSQQPETQTANFSAPTPRLADLDGELPTVPLPDTCETSPVPECADPSSACDPACVISLYPVKPLPTVPFQPAWRVDHFTWPKICNRLILRAAEELDRLADALSAAGAHGNKVLAVAGCRRGEGATTLLLSAARRLAERGIKLVLVDADLARPRLASRLGVQPQRGWQDTVGDQESSLAQALVEATATNLALLPAREPSSDENRPAADPSRLGRCIEILRERYDMVLVDLGPLENAGVSGDRPAWAAPGTIDAVVLTHDPRITTEAQLVEAERQLAAAGITAVGIVENFVAEG